MMSARPCCRLCHLPGGCSVSTGTGNIIAAMSRHGVKRLIVMSSSATEPHHHADGGFLLNRVLQPLITATIGKTTYADMRRMEDLVRRSDLTGRSCARPGCSTRPV
jgi:nucleoside-diphosphate-sugar epimerase